MSTPDYTDRIRKSGCSIYSPLDVSSPLYIPTEDLEALLNAGLRGFSTKGMALRTRSKAVKERVCQILGYPVPSSFQKTQPRFPGQNFDTYIQKSNNLQIWNEETDASRRYALIREVDGELTKVRVVAGSTLANLDLTGTLTQKYQARLTPGPVKVQAVSTLDTAQLVPLLTQKPKAKFSELPTAVPEAGKILPIAEVFERLKVLVGQTFLDLGRDQERNRGAGLHRLVCRDLGYASYADDGQFPDVKHQLLEVKLQTSPTIDLGLVTPDSTEQCDVKLACHTVVRHCDVRYAIFEAVTDGVTVTIKGFYLTTGTDFFSRFPRFGGNVLNKKLQIPLPSGFL